MASPQGSVSFFVLPYAAGTLIVPGNLLLPVSGTDGWVVATAAARGSIRCSGIAVGVTNGAGFGTVEIWQGGSIDPSISGLAVGAASWVRCSSAGLVERFTPANGGSSDVIGYCETDGRVHLLFGVLTETIIVGGGGAYSGSETLEQFGAVGDGATSDQTAFNAARSALAAGTSSALILGGKTYLVSGTPDPTNNPFPYGVHIAGQGAASVFKTTSNYPVVAMRDTDATNKTKAVVWSYFSVVGDGKSTGKTSQEAFRMGYLGGDGAFRVLMIGLNAKDIGGIGFVPAYSLKDGTGPTTAFCHAYTTNIGFVANEGESHGFHATDCTVGMQVGGNHDAIGGGMQGCDTAYKLIGGGNDAHGILMGMSILHNTIALDYGATNNGQYAVGIRIFEGQINIANGNLKFHTFSDCLIAPTQLNGNGKSRWLNCTFGINYIASTSFTGGENEFINPRGELGTIPSWIGINFHIQTTFASNADVNLTSQQSWAEVVEITTNAGATAAVNLLNIRTPSRGEKQLVVNRLGQTVNYFWGTGLGVAVPTGMTALVGFDINGTNMVCYQLSSNTATANVARPAAAVFPATLAFTGWMRSSYAGSPWAGTASAGTSATRSASEATNPPAVGTAVNALTPASFNGTSNLLTLSGTNIGDYFNGTTYTFAALVYANAVSQDFSNATPYENPAIISTTPNAYWGVYLRSSGRVQANHLDGTTRTVIDAAFTIGAWQFVQVRFGLTAGLLELRVNGGAWVTASGLNAQALLQNFRLGVNYLPSSAQYFNGKMLEVFLGNSALADTDLNNIRTYLNTRYGVTV